MRVLSPLSLAVDWSTAPAKFILRRQRRPVRASDGIVTAFRDGQVTLRDRRRTEGFTNALQEFGYQGVRRGDLVVHSMDGFAGAIGVSDSDGRASPVVHAYTSVGPGDTRFYAYQLRVLAWCGFVASLARGIRERSTAFDPAMLGSLRLPVPDPPTQTTIADYLDRETARIDALVEKKRRLIELLEEKRMVLISHAVTKGLDPTVPMKDSGIPWLGRVPAHWNVAQLRRCLTSITDGPFGSALTSSHYSESGARVIRLGNIGQGEFLDSDEAYIPLDYYEELRAFRVLPGDLVIAGLGDERRTLGRACVVPADLGRAIVKADCFRVRLSRDVSSTYVAEYLSSRPGAAGAWTLARGTTRQRINTAIARDILVPIPPLPEQRRIEAEIAGVRVRMAQVVARLNQQLALLAEYRQALVTAAVTGQLDVDVLPEALQEATS